MEVWIEWVRSQFVNWGKTGGKKPVTNDLLDGQCKYSIPKLFKWALCNFLKTSLCFSFVALVQEGRGAILWCFYAESQVIH